MEFSRPFTRPSGSSAWADNGRNSVEEWKQPSGIVRVGRREIQRQRDAIAVDNQVVLRSRLTPIRRVWPCLLTPFLARTLSESMLARLQPIAAASPNQLSSVSCSRAQTSASCQSRSRRQQVEPLPQPNSCGSNRHGQPVLRTKTMPQSALRSGIRGRPPFGSGGSLGSNG